MYLGWNDYELIYLIKEGNEKALNLMYQKYSNFIRIKARELGFSYLDIDDCVQEGLILLTKALIIYDGNFKKSFWSYFNLILKRRLWRLYKMANIHKTESLEVEVKDMNTFREKVREYGQVIKDEYLHYLYEEVYYYHTPIQIIADKLGQKSSKIYKDLQKIKEILRLEFDL